MDVQQNLVVIRYHGSGGVTIEDLSHFAVTFSDLVDSDVVDHAWA